MYERSGVGLAVVFIANSGYRTLKDGGTREIVDIAKTERIRCDAGVKGRLGLAATVASGAHVGNVIAAVDRDTARVANGRHGNGDDWLDKGFVTGGTVEAVVGLSDTGADSEVEVEAESL